MSSKIKNCKACGNEIAANAKTCPNCGAKNKKPIYKRPIIWIIAIVIIFAAVIGSSGSKQPETIDYSKPDFKVTADEIMNEFTENSVTAKEKYVGKLVEVTGKISSISDGIIRIKGEDDDNWLNDVVLSLATGQTDVVMSLSKNMKIKAVGKFEDTDLFDDVELKYSKIDTEGITVKTTEVKPSQAGPEEVIVIDIDDLIDAYEENSVAADSKYKDRTLKVTGKIYSIEDGYIKLEGSDEWDWTNIYAYYSSDEDVSNLKKGQKVTVVGVCKGEGLFSDIELKKCTIEK